MKDPDPIDMLNFERGMLLGNEIDLMDVMGNGGVLVEHGNPVPEASPGNWPIIWEWTLQDADGRIWTELAEID